jgi:hypothetical protein
MVFCEEGADFSFNQDGSVLAYGFIDPRQNWPKSLEQPNAVRLALGRQFRCTDRTWWFFSKTYMFNPYRSDFRCALCQTVLDEECRVVRSKDSWAAFVFLPSVTHANRYYIVPSSLGHMVNDHGYLPPSDVLRSFTDFRFDAEWNAAQAYRGGKIGLRFDSREDPFVAQYYECIAKRNARSSI